MSVEYVYLLVCVIEYVPAATELTHIPNIIKTAKIMITCFTLVVTLQHGIDDSILYINF